MEQLDLRQAGQRQRVQTPVEDGWQSLTSDALHFCPRNPDAVTHPREMDVFLQQKTLPRSLYQLYEFLLAAVTNDHKHRGLFFFN